MKKHTVLFVATLLVAGGAMAGMSQQSADSTSQSFQSIVDAAKTLGAGSATFASESGKLSKQALVDAVAFAGGAIHTAADSTSNSAKSVSDKAVSAASAVKNGASQSANSTSEAISAAAEYTVKGVKWAAKGSSNVIEVTFESIVNGTKLVGTFSINSASDSGKAMVEASKALFNAGKKVVVATSTFGVVMVTDSFNGTAQILDGQIKAGSSTIVTSVSDASRAFKSKLVE